MTTLHYLAYGSNLHPLRLQERVPSARFIGVAPLPGRAVTFHKRSMDGSGKCNLVAADASSVAYGAVYEFLRRDKPRLDAVEMCGGGYREVAMKAMLNGACYQPYVYLATRSHIDDSLRPYDWYHSLVIAGVRYYDLPEEYLSGLTSVSPVPDPDEERAATMAALLTRVAHY